MDKATDHTGKKYGRLLVQSCFVKDKATRCCCLCDCGNEVTTLARNLRSGHTTSCGCKNKKHGEYHTQLRRAWSGIKARCFNVKNKRYPYYGGRGIIMSPIWKDDYIAFRDYIGHPPQDGEKYSVERIDNSKGYEPGNIRWATCEEQARNKRKSNAGGTGVNGVNFDRSRNQYKATWRTLEGRRKTKTFTVNKYGEAEAFKLACEYRELMIKQLNAQGAGYSESHGR